MIVPHQYRHRPLRFLGLLIPISMLLLTPYPPATLLSAQTDNDVPADNEQSQYENWREILRYGIESQILDVIAILNRERIDDLSIEIKPLFFGNFSDDLLTAVLRYLSTIEDYSLVPEVTTILSEDPDEQKDTLLLQALFYLRTAPPRSLSVDTIDAVRALTADTRVTVARAAIDTLAVHGDPSDATLIQQLLDDPDTPDDVRGGTILAIGKLEIVDSLENLHRILENQQERSYLRQYAANSIGKLAKERSLPILIRFSLDDDSRLRAAVIEALARYQQQEASEILRDALRDSNTQVRIAATRAFRERPLDNEAFATLQYKATNDPSREVRLVALSILATHPGSEGTGYILEQISNTKIIFAVRAEMVGLLVEHDYPNSSAALMKLIRDELEDERKNLFLELIARRLATVDVPTNATELYVLLLESTDSDTVAYALQGINFNDARQLREQLQETAEKHEKIAIRKQAKLILDRWSSN